MELVASRTRACGLRNLPSGGRKINHALPSTRSCLSRFSSYLVITNTMRGGETWTFADKRSEKVVV